MNGTLKSKPHYFIHKETIYSLIEICLGLVSSVLKLTLPMTKEGGELVSLTKLVHVQMCRSHRKYVNM